MLKLNLKDRNFFPDLYSARSGICELLQWDRSCSSSGVVVYSDMFLGSHLMSKREPKIAWLLEPMEINPHIYNWIKHHYSIFEQVWTHDQEILDSVPNSKWIPMAGTWIERDKRKIYPKSKLCSFVASTKNFTSGHKLRQEVRKMLPGNVDKYGKGFYYLSDKADCLKDYRFSIVIENCIRDTYFTEKIIDCFNTGTIPIYWGTSRITEHFNGDGIIYFDSMSGLKYILEVLSEDMYDQKGAAIAENFERAKAFETGEEWIAKLFLR
jgi:hypothetical protein